MVSYANMPQKHKRLKSRKRENIKTPKRIRKLDINSVGVTILFWAMSKQSDFFEMWHFIRIVAENELAHM